MPADPPPLRLSVWVRRDCVRWADLGPYHWTAECIDGRALVELDHLEARAMSNLRPCKLCASRGRRRTGPAAQQPRRVTDR
jgi:hypothetical protein